MILNWVEPHTLDTITGWSLYSSYKSISLSILFNVNIHNIHCTLYILCIHYTVESNQFQHAVELGEKYEDFHILVYLCEELDDKKKLQEYMTRFTAQGFSDFLFKQYLDKGKLKKLLSFSEDFPQELSAFLTHHDSLSWLHHTAIKKYGKVNLGCQFNLQM